MNHPYLFRNKKTKDLYVVLFYAINATNSQEGEDAIVYMSAKAPIGISKVYTRDAKEFYTKFEQVIKEIK